MKEEGTSDATATAYWLTADVREWAAAGRTGRCCTIGGKGGGRRFGQSSGGDAEAAAAIVSLLQLRGVVWCPSDRNPDSRSSCGQQAVNRAVGVVLKRGGAWSPVVRCVTDLRHFAASPPALGQSGGRRTHCSAEVVSAHAWR